MPPTASAPVLYGFGSWLDNTRPASQRPLVHSLGAFGFFPWVTSLLNNHYHTLGYLRVGENLGPMMQRCSVCMVPSRNS